MIDGLLEMRKMVIELEDLDVLESDTFTIGNFILVISKSLVSVVKSNVSFGIVFQTFGSVLLYLLGIIFASAMTYSTFLGRMSVSETLRSVWSSAAITSIIAFVGILLKITCFKFLSY